MKKKFFSLSLGLACLISVYSCNSASTTEQPAAGTAQTGAATDTTAVPDQNGETAYICPMECSGSASMKPGKCPVCGMDLVKNPDYTAAADTQ